MKIKILGCGNSVGVPFIGCSCAVCCCDDTKNKRTRCSVVVETKKSTILIDASPDFRTQALREGITKLDCVFLTHIHYDHVTGIHDLQALLPIQSQNAPIIPIYSDEKTLSHLKNFADYLFVPRFGTAPWKQCYLEARPVSYYKDFFIAEENFFVFPQEHGNINCSGIIINNEFAYCTDVGVIPENAIKIMRSLNLKLLIIECFTYTEAAAHSNFDQALEYIAQIKPKRALFTHMSHQIEYNSVIAKLKSLNILNVEPAYDGLCVEL